MSTAHGVVDVPRHAYIIHVQNMRHLKLVWSVDVERGEKKCFHVRELARCTKRGGGRGATECILIPLLGSLATIS